MKTTRKESLATRNQYTTKQYAYRGYLIREIPRYGWCIDKDGYGIGSEVSEAKARETVELLTTGTVQS